VVAGGADQVDDVALEGVGHVDGGAAALDHLGDGRRVGHRLQVGQQGGGAAVGLQDLDLRLPGRVADRQLQHEAVALRLRQRVGALVLDRVLGGDDHERHPEVVGDAVHRHLPLLHGLQQGGLGLGGGAVDLVAEDDVGEDRPRLELEVTPLLVVDADAGDVRRQQVGGELDAADRAVDRPGQRLCQHGLADAGNVLDQQVPLGQQGDQRQADHLGLALDHPLDVDPDLVEGGGEVVHATRLWARRGHPRWLLSCGSRRIDCSGAQ
jgi:hypothetical protein